jgi:hypothetical protein
MKTYADLVLNQFYLVMETENEEIVLIEPILETAHCVLLMLHDDEERTFWRKKEDEIFSIVEELTDESRVAYDLLFEVDEFDED